MRQNMNIVSGRGKKKGNRGKLSKEFYTIKIHHLVLSVVFRLVGAQRTLRALINKSIND